MTETTQRRDETPYYSFTQDIIDWTNGYYDGFMGFPGAAQSSSYNQAYSEGSDSRNKMTEAEYAERRKRILRETPQ